MKRYLAVVMLLSFAAHAADDAPLVDEPVMVPKKQRIQEGKAMAACLATNESLTKGNVVVSTPVFIGIISGSVVLTAVVTGLIVGLAPKK